MALPLFLIAWTLVVTWLGLKLYTLIFNIYFHPLRKYPGPLCAAVTTWWRTYIEVFKKENWTDVLIRLHEKYGMYPPLPYSFRRLKSVEGDVIRVEPNEVGTIIIRKPQIRWLNVGSFISRNHPHTMTYTIQRRVGTRTVFCINASQLTSPLLGSSRTMKRSCGEMCFSHCSLGVRFLACRALLEKMYAAGREY